MFKKYLFALIENSYTQNSENIVNMLERQADAKILDLGCDDGAGVGVLANKIGTKNMYGIEIVEERAEIARKAGVRVYNEDLNKTLSLDNDFFDVVYSNQVIEHLYDTDSFISEIYRILKPNGYAIISTENLASWHNIFALLFGFQPFSMSNYSAKGNIGNPFALWDGSNAQSLNPTSWQHNRLFSYYALKDIFKKYGFQIEKIQTSGYYPLWGKLSRLDPIHGHWIAVKIRKI